jgi:DNA-binding transcriptional LysR family regulator
LNISLNLYRIFYITASSKTILEASEKLYISQPAVSKSIKKLEEQLNVNLFYRNKSGIELTPDGKILLEYIDKSYNYLLAGQKMLEDIKVLKKGNLVIGVPSHIACFYALKYIKKIMEVYPEIKIRLISASTTILTNELYNHKIDVIIDSPPIKINDENVVIENIAEFDTIFITDNINKNLNLTIENIENHQFILPNTNSEMYKLLNKKLTENGWRIKSKLSVDTTDVIISSVKYGMGIGYVVKEAVIEELKQGTIKELKTPFELPKLKLNLVYMKNSVTSATKEFIKIIKKN